MKNKKVLLTMCSFVAMMTMSNLHADFENDSSTTDNSSDGVISIPHADFENVSPITNNPSDEIASIMRAPREKGRPIPSSRPDGIILEFRTSYFYPTSKIFREIFPTGGVDFQITGTFPVYFGPNEWIRGLDLWGAVDYFSKTGHSIGLKTKTKIAIVPLTVGLKYFFPGLGYAMPVNFYVAGGFKYFFVHNHNDSSRVTRIINVDGMGGVVEAGFITTFVEHLVLDVFASYSFRTFSGPCSSNPALEPARLDISGFNVGLGLGYRF